jgi:hypothetical protein
MNLDYVNAAAPLISGAPSMGGNVIIDLDEVRAARSRAAAAAAAERMTPENVFEGLERQARIVGAAAELMISGMNRFIDELEVLRRDVAIAKEFCTLCHDACELEDIDAMIEARDRLRVEFDERISGSR